MKRISKRIMALCLCLSILLIFSQVVLAEELPFEVESKSALLMDYDTETILYEKNLHDEMPIASVTKIMTTLLALEAIEDGRIALEDEVTISDYAASMGGSQVFLSPGEKLPVSAILKAIIIASGNDASVAIAEKISGTIETFVDNMNKRAKELGMENSNFTNCTGLSDDNNYSTAYDVSIMSRELLRHPIFFQWSTIWIDNLEESANNTELTNTNRLVRFYDGCDGIKTGYTDKAQSCLSASAKRGNLRLISIVLAAPNSKIRFAEASKLMDYGFANYEALPIVKKDDMIKKDIMITGGKQKILSGVASDDFSILQKKGENDEYEIENFIEEPLKAPITKGQKIGSMYIQKDGKKVTATDILADRDIEIAGFYDYFKQVIHSWISKSDGS